MQFEWDEQKNADNILKHGIDFTDIPPVFDSPMLIDLDNRQEYGEDRSIGIGLLKNFVVVVVFTEREHDTIRIISARKANKYERKRYTESIPY